MDLQHNRELLTEVALKATETRLAILTLLHTTSSPVDASQIMSYLHKNNIASDPATVFRTMNTFTQAGLTREIQFHEGKSRYELARVAEHHHLVCTVCGRVEDISDCSITDLEREIEKKKKFKVSSHSLEFFGVCNLCQH